MAVIHLDGAYSPPVRFEPCQAYAADGAAGVCCDCGWLEEDHLHFTG